MSAKSLAIWFIGVPLGVMVVMGRGEVAEDAAQTDASAEFGSEAMANVAQSSNDGWYGGDVVLDRKADGHFYANALVEGASVDFLVDTGASTIALTAEDADAAGIYWGEQDLRPVARGASGVVYGVPVTLQDVRLGDFEANGIQAMVIPEGLPISLLGQSFLREIPDVAIQGDSMTLSN